MTFFSASDRSVRNNRRRGARLRLETLEDRVVPATLLGLSDTNSLVRFDSATPNTITSTTAITGLAVGENVLGIDYRPANGLLYAVTSTNRLLTINATTGASTLVANLTADPTDLTNPFTALSGTSFGVDFNPVPDRFRVVSDADQNLRINPDTGRVTTDDPLDYATGDPNDLANPNVVAVAYTNNFAGATTTTLNDIDFILGILATQSPPNNGTLNTVGTLAQNAQLATGFDIQTTGASVNTAFAIVDDLTGDTNLATVNLGTGLATLVGVVGDGTVILTGLAVVPAGTLNFTVNAFSVNENGATATVTITRTGGSLGPVSVQVATAPGSATAGLDFTTTTTTVNFADGDTVAKTVIIPILDDQVFEGVETFTVTLSNATGDAALGAISTVTVAIADNELPRTTLYGVNVVNGVTQLIEFSSNTPGTIRRTTPILGLAVGENVVGIDFRPATGQLYGLGVNSVNARLVIINTSTGGTTQVGAAFVVAGTDFGFDFNPTTDRLRVTSDADINLSINPADGVVTVQTNLNPGNPNVVGSSYTNSFAGANATTLFAIDSVTDQLFTQVPAAGTLSLIGNLGTDTTGLVGFEIAPINNQAFASLTAPGATTSRLFSINLGSAATAIGTIAGGSTLRAMTSLTLNTINFTSNQRFVAQLFVDILGRAADQTGLAFFASRLEAGTLNRSQVAAAILNSTEARTIFVQGEFQRLLGRLPDQAGLNFFVNFLAGGGTQVQLTAAIVGSPEYFALNGGTNNTFLAAAYDDLLGRPIDAAGQAFFGARLQNGTLTRTDVAVALQLSTEGLQRTVQLGFQRVLGRAADPTALAFFTTFLQQGRGANDLLAALFSSAEYQALIG